MDYLNLTPKSESAPASGADWRELTAPHPDSLESECLYKMYIPSLSPLTTKSRRCHVSITSIASFIIFSRPLLQCTAVTITFFPRSALNDLPKSHVIVGNITCNASDVEMFKPVIFILWQKVLERKGAQALNSSFNCFLQHVVVWYFTNTLSVWSTHQDCAFALPWPDEGPFNFFPYRVVGYGWIGSIAFWHVVKGCCLNSSTNNAMHRMKWRLCAFNCLSNFAIFGTLRRLEQLNGRML